MNTYCICVNNGYGFMRIKYFCYVKKMEKETTYRKENEIHNVSFLLMNKQEKLRVDFHSFMCENIFVYTCSIFFFYI